MVAQLIDIYLMLWGPGYHPSFYRVEAIVLSQEPSLIYRLRVTRVFVVSLIFYQKMWFVIVLLNLFLFVRLTS